MGTPAPPLYFPMRDESQPSTARKIAAAVYPADWKDVSRFIRVQRAQGQCECCGECGLHSTHPGPRRCLERDGQPAQFARGTVVLTTAHQCNCCPLCSDPGHLKAMCNRCHMRIDIALHYQHRLRNERLRLEGAGQQVLFTEAASA